MLLDWIQVNDSAHLSSVGFQGLASAQPGVLCSILPPSYRDQTYTIVLPNNSSSFIQPTSFTTEIKSGEPFEILHDRFNTFLKVCIKGRGVGEREGVREGCKGNENRSKRKSCFWFLGGNQILLNGLLNAVKILRITFHQAINSGIPLNLCSSSKSLYWD